MEAILSCHPVTEWQWQFRVNFDVFAFVQFSSTLLKPLILYCGHVSYDLEDPLCTHHVNFSEGLSWLLPWSIRMFNVWKEQWCLPKSSTFRRSSFWSRGLHIYDSLVVLHHLCHDKIGLLLKHPNDGTASRPCFCQNRFSLFRSSVALQWEHGGK